MSLGHIPVLTDMKLIKAIILSIGEIEYDAEVILPQCGQCANPMPEGDKILYTVSAIQNQKKKMITA